MVDTLNREAALPNTPEEVDAEALTALVGAHHPGVSVTGMTQGRISGYGENNVSTSARVLLDLAYDPPNALPGKAIVKMSLGADSWCGQLHAIYANEVDFYTRLRPELEIETPRALGGRFDRQSQQYVLVLEDVTARGARFPSIMDELRVEDVQNVLDTLARLHAHFWDSPRFGTDLSWVQTHVTGDVHDLMNGLIRDGIRDQIRSEKYKRELIGRMGTSEEELHAGVAALQRHQATLPQTLLHGDTHIGNIYLMPDAPAGLYDWQISVRGYAMHDVTYQIVTALSIEMRRRHERELLAFYRDRLAAYGVANPPSLDTLWLEHRRAAIWGVYIGWLTTPIVNYGWEVNIMAHLRVTAAYEDLDTRKLVAELL